MAVVLISAGSIPLFPIVFNSKLGRLPWGVYCPSQPPRRNVTQLKTADLRLPPRINRGFGQLPPGQLLTGTVATGASVSR